MLYYINSLTELVKDSFKLQYQQSIKKNVFKHHAYYYIKRKYQQALKGLLV